MGNEGNPSLKKYDIELDHVSVALGGEWIHRDLTFTIRQGEFVGVIGPNGGGKTTFLRLLLGLLKPDRGAIYIGGKQVKSKGSTLLGYVPQSRPIDPDTPLQAWDFVSFGLKRYLPPWHTAKEKEKIREMLRLVGAESYMYKSIGRLSGGERQRLFLAQALLSEPKCLLLDEPTSALDPGSQERLVELVDHVCRQFHITVVFISHDVNLISRYADRIIYFTKGGYAIGTPAEVMTSEVLTRLYGMPTEVISMGDKIIVSTASSRENTSICTHQFS